MSTEQIARKGYRALQKGKSWIIPDTFSSILMRLDNRILPTNLKMRFSYNTIMKGEVL